MLNVNSIRIPAQLVCKVCDAVQEEDREHCKACGVSFIFGQPNGWTSKPLADSTNKGSQANLIERIMKSMHIAEPRQKCLWDDVAPGVPMSLSCPCPKCNATY